MSRLSTVFCCLVILALCVSGAFAAKPSVRFSSTTPTVGASCSIPEYRIITGTAEIYYCTGNPNGEWIIPPLISDQLACFFVEDADSDDDDMPIIMHNKQLTLDEGWCVCIPNDGDCTTEADIEIEHYETGCDHDAGCSSGDYNTVGTITCEDWDDWDSDEDGGYDDVVDLTTGGNETVPAFDVLIFNVDNTPSTGDKYMICVTFAR